MTLSRPRLESLIFEVTQACNHACLHCYNVWQGMQAIPYPHGQLSTSQTIDLLAIALEQTTCSQVTLTGGEPLLRPDLPQILEFLQRKHVNVNLISNGHLLTESAVASLIELGVGLFELPLLSDGSELHDELSAAPGAWEAVLSAMTSIRRHHGQVVASFVATRKNIACFGETLRLAFAFGVRGVMFNRFNPGGRGRSHLSELLPSVDQVASALEVAEKAVVELGLPVSCSIPIQPCLIDLKRYPHVSFGFCAAGGPHAYYTLDPLGNVRPCNHSDLILGNLFQTSFSELIASPRLQEFVCSLPDYCMPCEQRTTCQGGCKASAQVCYGSLCEVEPFLRQQSSIVNN